MDSQKSEKQTKTTDNGRTEKRKKVGRLSLRLDEVDVQRMKDKAAAEGKTLSEAMRDAFLSAKQGRMTSRGVHGCRYCGGSGQIWDGDRGEERNCVCVEAL